MAWRYRDRETKQLVSEANYNRSRSQGGIRFERFSDAKWNVRRAAPVGPVEALPVGIGKPGPSKILQRPRTAREYTKIAVYMEEIQEMEFETGVDY